MLTNKKLKRVVCVNKKLVRWVFKSTNSKFNCVADHSMRVTMSSQVSHSQSVLPLFMGKSRNITFILDSSVGMNGFLGPVKNLIIQTLITKASLRDSLFNIISFSYKVNLQWITLNILSQKVTYIYSNKHKVYDNCTCGTTVSNIEDSNLVSNSFTI